MSKCKKIGSLEESLSGVRQGDTSSPKLFTLALEDVFGRLTWDQKGINVDGKPLPFCG